MDDDVEVVSVLRSHPDLHITIFVYIQMSHINRVAVRLRGQPLTLPLLGPASECDNSRDVPYAMPLDKPLTGKGVKVVVFQDDVL